MLSQVVMTLLSAVPPPAVDMVFTPRTPPDAVQLMPAGPKVAARWCIQDPTGHPAQGAVHAALQKGLEARGVTLASPCEHTLSFSVTAKDSGPVMVPGLRSYGVTVTLQLSDSKGKVVGQGSGSNNIPCIDAMLKPTACSDRVDRPTAAAVADLLATSKILGASQAPSQARKQVLATITGTGVDPTLPERTLSAIKESLAPAGLDVVTSGAADLPTLRLHVTQVDTGPVMIQGLHAFALTLNGSLIQPDGGRVTLKEVQSSIPCVQSGLTPPGCWKIYLDRVVGPFAAQAGSTVTGRAQSQPTPNKLRAERVGTMAWAGQAGDLTLLKELIASDRGAVGTGYPLPLDAAVDANQLQAAELLLQQGATSTMGRSHGAVHYAAGLKDDRMLKLLARYGAPLHVGGNDGQTPLHVAAQENNGAGVDFLLSQKVPVDARDNMDVNALWHAAQTGAYTVVRVLLRQEATTVETTPWRGENTLNLLARKGPLDVVEDALKVAKPQGGPLAKRFDAQGLVALEQDRAAFEMALNQADARAVNALLKKRKELAVGAFGGQDVLSCAAQSNSAPDAVRDVGEMLLAAGADPNGEPWRSGDRRPLGVALRANQLPLVRLLVKKGGDLGKEESGQPVGCSARDTAAREFVKDQGFQSNTCRH